MPVNAPPPPPDDPVIDVPRTRHPRGNDETARIAAESLLASDSALDESLYRLIAGLPLALQSGLPPREDVCGRALIRLDGAGRVLRVESLAASYADDARPPRPSPQIGDPYLDHWLALNLAGPALAASVAEGIAAVLEGRRASFETEYVDADVSPPQWCRLQVLSLGTSAQDGALVIEADVSARRQREQHHSESQRRLDCIIGSAMDAILDVDDRGRITHVNPTAERMFGHAVGELIGQPLELLLPARFRQAHGRHVDQFAASAQRSQRMALRSACGLRRNGEEFPVEVSIAKSEQEGRRHFTAIVRDISARVRSEEQIRRLNRVHAMLTDISSLIVRVADRAALFAGACRIAVELGGFEQALILGLAGDEPKLVPLAVRCRAGSGPSARLAPLLALLCDPLGRPALCALQALRERRPVVLDLDAEAAGATARPPPSEASLLAVLPLAQADRVVGLLVLHTRELEHFHAQELALLSKLADDIAFAMDYLDKRDRLDYLAYYDALTGLANRSLFLERVAQFMRSAAADASTLALYLVDLDRFKTLNDSLGRAAGDGLLRQLAAWLTQRALDSSLVARVGPDQFAVVLPAIGTVVDLARRIETELEAIAEHPFRLDAGVFRIAAKSGIALFPGDGDSAEALFRNAEAALKRAKRHGERYLFYTRSMTETVAGRLTLESELRAALRRHEFVLHYQPKRSLDDGRIVGAEALIRWQDARRGLVMPTEFVPVLEETGLIHEVGRWALQQAVRDHQDWCRQGYEAVRIAVNVSPLQLRHRDFIDDLRRVLGGRPESAAALKLEITEGLIMEDVQRSVSSLSAIRAMGVPVAIDDFGTGYSSLSYLAKLPVDSLKIDRSFVEGLGPDTPAAALIATIVSLGRSLKLSVVAEGVETEAQAQQLRALGCREVQGFLVSEAVPADLFAQRFLCVMA